MPTALEQLRSMFADIDTALAGEEAARQQYGAALASARDAVRDTAQRIEVFVAENATQLVSEAVDKLKADEAAVAAKDASIADLTAKVSDLEGRAVPQETLDALNTILHPAPANPPAADPNAPPAAPAAPPAA